MTPESNLTPPYHQSKCYHYASKVEIKLVLQVEGAAGVPHWQMAKKAKGNAPDQTTRAFTSALPGQ